MKPTLILLAVCLLAAFSPPASAHHASAATPCYLVFWKGNPGKTGMPTVSAVVQEPWRIGFVSKFRIVGEGLSITLP